MNNMKDRSISPVLYSSTQTQEKEYLWPVRSDALSLAIKLLHFFLAHLSFSIIVSELHGKIKEFFSMFFLPNPMKTIFDLDYV